jgi:hypothetical protein
VLGLVAPAARPEQRFLSCGTHALSPRARAEGVVSQNDFVACKESAGTDGRADVWQVVAIVGQDGERGRRVY